MALKLFTICRLLSAVSALININITASSNENENEVKMTGTNLAIISDEERTNFKLDNESLKDGVYSYLGSRPDDVYIQSPGPMGDVFQRLGPFHFVDVNRVLSPKTARVISVSTQPIAVSTQFFHNNSSKTVEYKVILGNDVKSTISSTWETNGESTNIQAIRYNFNIKASSSVLGVTEFGYDFNWGKNVSKSKTVTVHNPKSSVIIDIEPNQAIISELYAIKVTMKVKVDYEARLSGDITVYFDETYYEGHHLWALDVEEVMKSAGLNNSILSSEVIGINYYTDSRLIIRSPCSNVVFHSIPLSLYYDSDLKTIISGFD